MPCVETQMRQRVAERYQQGEITFDRAMLLISDIRRFIAIAANNSVMSNYLAEDLRARIEVDQENVKVC